MALDKIGIAKRIAQELRDGWYVNLGIGIPTLVANYVPEGLNVEFQSENGVLGMGPFPFEGEESTLKGEFSLRSASKALLEKGEKAHVSAATNAKGKTFLDK